MRNRPPVIITLILILTVVGYLIYYLINRKSKKKYYLDLIPAANKVVKEYKNTALFEFYLDERKFQLLRSELHQLNNSMVYPFHNIGLSIEQIELFNFVRRVYSGLEPFRQTYNQDFINHEFRKYGSFFKTLGNHSLSTDQIHAIVSDEINNLVIAGAGTGKTTTIAGKVAYILEKQLAKASEILVISFTNAAVNEMSVRINNYCQSLDISKEITVKTFNSFGFEISRTVKEDPNLRVAFTNAEDKLLFMDRKFHELFLEDDVFQRNAINFLAFFNRPSRDEFSVETGDEFYKQEKGFKNVSIDGNVLKSKEEVEIANFLFLHNIKYEYEKLYPIRQEDADYRFGAYQPDFFLNDYNVWIEHFGIDRAGNVSKRFHSSYGTTASQRYSDGMRWKRSIHETYGSVLIETYSYENSEGTLIHNLKRKLGEGNITLRKRDPADILSHLEKCETYHDFNKLVINFLNLLKSNNIGPNDVLAKSSNDKRLNIFISVFQPLYEHYQRLLFDETMLDYDDMINEAAAGIKGNQFIHTFKYILVDEFQDMSLGRYRLLQAMKTQNPLTKLYCVGDDWQSIFRFAGSDISIITKFQDYFGYTKFSDVLNTYRFNDEILGLTSSFIQKNPAQRQKNLMSLFVAEQPSFEFIGLGFDRKTRPERRSIIKSQIHQILDQLADQTFPEKIEVFIIGRYNFNNPNIICHHENLSVDYFTAHSVKGKTSDYSIIIDIDSGIYGFPSEVVDDPILEYLLHEGDRFENAEERRLFYVALTRARHKNFLFYDENNESKFIGELREDLGYYKEEGTDAICPECHGKMVIRNSTRGSFWGCSHYPKCKGTKPNISHGLEPKQLPHLQKPN